MMFGDFGVYGMMYGLDDLVLVVCLGQDIVVDLKSVINWFLEVIVVLQMKEIIFVFEIVVEGVKDVLIGLVFIVKDGIIYQCL